jgi:ATP synthase protein I
MQSLPGRRIIGWQFFLAIITAALLLPVFGLVAAYSAFAGGLISAAANAIFAIRLFDDKGSWQAEYLTATLYRGLLGKYFLTIALFILAMVLIEPLNIAALFAAYLWIQVSPALIAGVLKA